MASFWLNPTETTISIPNTEEVDGVTLYNIQINIANIFWNVKHRYNDFYELHQRLVAEHGVAKDLLPPKKVIKNKCPLFIEQRRLGLETYLKYVLTYFQCTMPRLFIKFLDFHEYDIFFLLQQSAFNMYNKIDGILQTNKKYTFTILEIHAISECLKKPNPSVDCDKRYDICHVLDLCSQLQHVIVRSLPGPYLMSNICPNELPFELSAFKKLETLDVVGITMQKVYSLGNLRSTLKILKVRYSMIYSISCILLCDIVHKDTTTDNEIWHSIIELDLSNNSITKIDNSMKLVPKLKVLDLTENQIITIENLTILANLSTLILSNNLVLDCSNLHTKLGNIRTIDLSQNRIVSLKGFEKLYSLENLDVSSNNINDIEEIKYIGPLPCLESVRLTGNPISVIVDYRVRVLEFFGSRAAEIYLDNEKATQKEVDTAFVLQALRILKEGKSPDLNQKFM